MNISKRPHGDQVPSNWRHLAESATLWSRAWRQFGHLGARGPRSGIPTLVIPGFVAKHPVTDPPIPRITDKPPVPHLAIWSRRDGLIAPRAARGLDHERDHEAELDCHHMAFGVSRSAARKVVQQINNFLKSLT